MTLGPTTAPGDPSGVGRPVPPTTGSKIILGCVLAPVLFFLVMSVLGMGLMGIFAALGDRGPWKGMSVGPQIGFFVSGLLMTLFFARVARGLLAAMRGQVVPHILPPWLTVVLAAVLGLACVSMGVGALVAGTASHGMGTGIGMGITFLGYAYHAIRTRLRRKADAPPEPPAPA